MVPFDPATGPPLAMGPVHRGCMPWRRGPRVPRGPAQPARAQVHQDAGASEAPRGGVCW